MIRTIVCGIAGRMGKRLTTLITKSEDLRLAGATEVSGHPAIGQDMGAMIGTAPFGVTIVDDLESIIDNGDVVVDFTAPQASLNNAKICASKNKAMVVGTTGFTEAQLTEFKRSVAGIPCVFSPNYSVGVNLLFKLVEKVASIIGEEFDIEIIEAHHRFKKDAPSGTAKRLAEVVGQVLSRDLERVLIHGRSGRTGERSREEIGIHAIRAGDIVGEHKVFFGGMGESVELIHRVTSRDTFARGALRAVRFVAEAQPGLYDM
ncbi:MAG TPA: 4-hydroxy-tetrahydrodipicolinate reductase, partial [Candidatus Latescibacteria bacterium]|nr:4-hydroxy-tetrahydrodipicolinate reductase [Candidatus Latescibacterota bacterium]